MRKFLFKSVLAIVVLCLAVFGFAACSDDEEPSDGKFPSVDADTIKVSETAAGIILSWGEVPMASNYAVTCNSFKTSVTSNYINMSRQTGFTLPADGEFNFTIVAKSYGYDDSDPVNFQYTAKGVTLDSPQIKSFENGVLEWSPVTSASAYKVSVDGANQSDGSDGLYHKTTLDMTAFAAAGTTKVEISAVGSNDKYFKASASVTVGVNAARTKLMLLPITEYTLKDGVISWDAVGGASAYRVVDINMTVAKTIKAADELSYDMTGNNLIVGVFPISADKAIADAEVAPVAIKYLDGAGTASSPYLITTAFDLRAIDYYEFMYAEELAAGKTPAQNRYRLEKAINFNSVAALDNESNFFTLTRPFYGYLDGNFKKLSNVRVVYDGGYWAMFDFIATGAEVRNITFDNTEISNSVQDPDFPINASIAAIAFRNYGTIRGITLNDARFTATGGAVAGICTNNYGTVTKCTVSGEFVQKAIKDLIAADAHLLYNQVSYEMAGIVIENFGTVSENRVETLDIRGSECENVTEWKYGDYGDRQAPLKWGTPYNNVRSAAGIVSINRAGGAVTGNSYGTVNLIRVLGDYSGSEFGGIVAYNASRGVITYSASHIGTFTYSSTASVGGKITAEIGKTSDYRGSVVGKNDGSSTTSKA